MHPTNLNNQKGFTLIEVVVVLIITAIVGSMLFQYVRSATDSTAEQLTMVRDTLALQQAMEEATGRYKSRYQAMLDAGMNPASVSILTAFKNNDVAPNLSNGVTIDTVNTKFIRLSRNAGTKTYVVSTATDSEQKDAHLMLVLDRGGQRVLSIFSDSD